jgi:hypothetical protein
MGYGERDGKTAQKREEVKEMERNQERDRE